MTALVRGIPHIEAKAISRSTCIVKVALDEAIIKADSPLAILSTATSCSWLRSTREEEGPLTSTNKQGPFLVREMWEQR